MVDDIIDNTYVGFLTSKNGTSSRYIKQFFNRGKTDYNLKLTSLNSWQFATASCRHRKEG